MSQLPTLVLPIDDGTMECDVTTSHVKKRDVRRCLFGDCLTDLYCDRIFIAKGSFSSVYKAYERATGETVALKSNAGFHEAKALRMLSGAPNVIGCKGYINGTLILEYMPMTLDKYIKTNRVRLGEQKSIIRQVLTGIAACHKIGIVHADIKPDNIMLDEKGVAKLADFNCVNGAAAGLFHWRSPELLLGYAPSKASDMWAVGCLIAFVLKGVCIFIDYRLTYTASTQLEYIKKILRGDLLDCVDKATIDFLRQFLEFEPSKRISAAEALRHPYLS